MRFGEKMIDGFIKHVQDGKFEEKLISNLESEAEKMANWSRPRLQNLFDFENIFKDQCEELIESESADEILTNQEDF